MYLVQYLFYLLQPSLLLVASLSSRRTIQSQIIRKLNPMKSPRQPPQSATRDAKENASSSLLTRTESLANTGNSSVLALGISVGVWAICIFNHHGIVKIDSCSYKLIIEYLIETNLTCVDLNSNHVQFISRTDLRVLPSTLKPNCNSTSRSQTLVLIRALTSITLLSLE